MRDAARRRITISEAIQNGRAAARRRPLVDPSGAEPGTSASASDEKSLEIERADARTRTADPFITREGRVGDARPRAGTRGHVIAGN